MAILLGNNVDLVTFGRLEALLRGHHDEVLQAALRIGQTRRLVLLDVL